MVVRDCSDYDGSIYPKGLVCASAPGRLVMLGSELLQSDLQERTRAREILEGPSWKCQASTPIMDPLLRDSVGLELSVLEWVVQRSGSQAPTPEHPVLWALLPNNLG